MTRAQIATFLTRALGLVPLSPTVVRTTYRIAYTTAEESSTNGILIADKDGTGQRQ